LLGGVVFLSVYYFAIQRILQLVLFLFRSTEFNELEIIVRATSCRCRNVRLVA